ncbi:hypothetical protein D9M68_982350 [compost metagenome]
MYSARFEKRDSLANERHYCVTAVLLEYLELLLYGLQLHLSTRQGRPCLLLCRVTGESH